jgi:hypothetical protein
MSETTPEPRHEQPMEKEMAFVLAQLRHGYQQLIQGAVKNQHAFARGLIGPCIEKLERAQGETCTWTQGQHSDWFSDCGFDCVSDAPTDLGWTFCCYCGKALREVPFHGDSVR